MGNNPLRRDPILFTNSIPTVALWTFRVIIPIIEGIFSNFILDICLHTFPRISSGLIIISLPIDDDSAHRLQQYALEAVFIEYSKSGFSSIEIENERGGEMAAQFLIQKGYRSFAFLGDAGEQLYSVHPSDQRLSGYRNKLRNAGFDLPDEHICLMPYSREHVVDQAGTLLDLPKRPEAIFAASDLQAIGVLKAARQRQLRVPEDVAVIGFDDLEISDFMELTTIDQELDESGRLAAELLLNRIAERKRPQQNIRLPLNIIERSTA